MTRRDGGASPPLAAAKAMFLEVTIGVGLFEDILAEYDSPGAALYEIWRNGANACMTTGWNPGQVHIEVDLERNHPLGPEGNTLIVLDHGPASGMTDPRIKRFTRVSRGREDPREGHQHGSSQKGIGRFASFFLKIDEARKKLHEGFYVFSRTAPGAPIFKLTITLAGLEDRKIPKEEVPANSIELGRFKSIKGPFTMIVIPDCVFGSIDEVREAIKWYLPRRKNLAFKTFLVGGKALEAPKLGRHPKRLSDGTELFIDKVEVVEGKNPHEHGIWLVDEITGFRVAWARRMSSHLPFLVSRPEVSGDCFIGPTLGRQNKDRSGLHPDFLKTRTWLDRRRVLALEGVPFLQSILGEDGVFHETSKDDQRIEDTAKRLNKAFGEPTITRIIDGDDPTGGGNGDDEEPPKPPGPGGGGPKPPKPHNPPKPPGPDDDKPKRKKPKLAVATRIGDHEFFITKGDCGPNVYAEVNPDGTEIQVNPKHYAGFPTAAGARAEHELLAILDAVAHHLFRHEPERIAEYRGRLAEGYHRGNWAGSKTK